MCYSMNEPWKHYAMYTEYHILFNSVYMKCLE